MYFETVNWAISKPSFRSSPWICGAPQSVLGVHSSDKVAQLFVNLRSATERAGFPSPKRTEAFAMPTHDRLRSDDRYGVKDTRKTAIDPNEQGAISPAQI